MSLLSLQLPHSMHDNMKDLTQQEGLSIDQFIMLVVTEKWQRRKPRQEGFPLLS